ncbi:WD repeat-containing protein 75-like [Chenopodium quinoa]|uniref:WD repeat-containing protein 75-like n=1 Tax=Chenopodium quinoa TaxID=63459 RepID=UPI000B793A1B|nr:WD repeat-containing protein 75-like [Chenopodium quinoa]
MIYGGKSFVSSLPAFSKDAKRLLICSGNTVSVFSTSTGMQITELEGHRALVTSVVVVPSSSKLLCYCWTSSLDGTIRYWDFAVPELMKTVDIRLPVFSMVIPKFPSKQEDEGGKPTDLFAYISVEDVSNPGDKTNRLLGQIRKCNLTKSKLIPAVILKETARPEFITCSPSGEFFGIHIKRSLYIWKVPADESERALVRKMKLHHTKNFTTFAFHPNHNVVATGDASGRICVWRGFGARTFFKGNDKGNAKLMKSEDERTGVREDDDVESCSTWHWHSSEVKFLAFSTDGAYLYSGGNEGVLVLWQLDTGKRKFLPRIGSPLLHFVHSCDPTLSVISCADNQIHFLKMPSLEILKSIAGIKLPCSFPDMWNGLSSGFTFDHSAGLVALPTDNYRIQFYSLLDDTEITEVQICERNHQPSDEITVVVSFVALSHDGSLMSTIETRLAEDGVGGLVCLKFWESETQEKEYNLSTIVYEPHRDAAVSAVVFHPRRKMAVSCSYGGDFKIWVQSNTTQSKGGVDSCSGWLCHSVGSYKGKSMTAATFSADGSILAIAAETVITLWDPDRNYLVSIVGETYTPIVNLTFVGDSEYIVSTSQGSRPQLSLWCLSKLSRAWSYGILVEAVACMEDDPFFAVLAVFPDSSVLTESHRSSISSGDGMILLFDINSPVPVGTWLVRKAKGGGLAFLQQSQLSSLKNNLSGSPSALLAYFDRDHEYVVFDPLSKEQHEPNLNHKKGAVDFEESGQHGYASIYGELPIFDPKKTTQATISLSERPWETIFNGPSHTLPPLTKLCSAFLESLLEKRTAATG